MSFICCRCCSFNWQRKLGPERIEETIKRAERLFFIWPETRCKANLKVLIVEPGYSPYEADIENTPASLTAVLESEQYTAAFPFDNTVIAAVYGGV